MAFWYCLTVRMKMFSRLHFFASLYFITKPQDPRLSWVHISEQQNLNPVCLVLPRCFLSVGRGAVCTLQIDMVPDLCVSFPVQAFCDDAVGLKFNPVLYPKVRTFASLWACCPQLFSLATGAPWRSSLNHGGVMCGLYGDLLYLFLFTPPQTGTLGTIPSYAWASSPAE